jgi:hypothetical protein
MNQILVTNNLQGTRADRLQNSQHSHAAQSPNRTLDSITGWLQMHAFLSRTASKSTVVLGDPGGKNITMPKPKDAPSCRHTNTMCVCLELDERANSNRGGSENTGSQEPDLWQIQISKPNQ